MASKYTKAELEEQLQRLKEETDIRIAKLENELAQAEADKAIRQKEERPDAAAAKILSYIKKNYPVLWNRLTGMYGQVKGVK